MATDARNQCFERLAMPHLDAAFNLGRWLTGNIADAEDVVQDAYLRALRYLRHCGAIESGIHREINDGGYQAAPATGGRIHAPRLAWPPVRIRKPCDSHCRHGTKN
jgi:hypothetical protein